MNTVIHHLSSSDLSLWSDTTVPLFSITQETLEAVRNFQQSHPDIDLELFNKELNLTIKELLFRIDREYQGI